jgi:beta-lactam-binding protein with PASTA domain
MRAARKWLLSVVGTILVVTAAADPPVGAAQQPRISPEASRPTTRQAPTRPASPPIQLERRAPQRPPQPGPQRPDAGGVAQDPRTTRPRPDDPRVTPGRPRPNNDDVQPDPRQTGPGDSRADPGRRPRPDAGRDETPCVVPELRALGDAAAVLKRRGFVLGSVNRVASARYPTGRVISQSPSAGTALSCGSRVDITVAEQVADPDGQGPKPCRTRVPDLVDDAFAEATQQIAGARLRVGRAARTESTRREGTILRQHPDRGTVVECNAPVDLWVAVPPPQEPQPPPCTTRVPDVVSNMYAEATQQIAGARLRVGRAVRAESTRREGTILRQHPDRGTVVDCGAGVDIWVAVPPPPPPSAETDQCRTRVPNLLDAWHEDVAAQVERARLRLGRATRAESTARPGTVVRQWPNAGTVVECNTPVEVSIAVPPPPPPEPPRPEPPRCPTIAVPPLAGQNPKAAVALLEGRGLNVGSVFNRESTGPAGLVIDQWPVGGSMVPCNTNVNLWVSVPPPPPQLVRVPALEGIDQAAAEQRLKDAGLRLGNAGRRPSEAAEHSVVGQSPVAGTLVPPSSPVQIWLASAPPPTVPDLRGLDRAGAASALATARLRLGLVTDRQSEEAAGTVVAQAPAAGTVARAGGAVDVSLAVPVQVVVPGVLGRREFEASSVLREHRLRPGEIKFRESAEPRGTVLEQVPEAGRQVTVNSEVALWLATPRRVLVPDLRGRSQRDATERLRAVGLVVGHSSEQMARAPRGTVLAQQPAANEQVDVGTAVSLSLAVPPPVVAPPIVQPPPPSTPPVAAPPVAPPPVAPPPVAQPVTVRVPLVVGTSMAKAFAALQAAGLRPGSLSEIRAFASAGTITTQFPAAGTEVQPGAPVDLVVAVPLGLTPWAFAGIGIGLALAAAGSLARRIRSRRPSVPPVFSFAPQADPGEQSVSAESGELTDCAFTIEAHVDRGAQTFDMSSRRAA